MQIALLTVVMATICTRLTYSSPTPHEEFEENLTGKTEAQIEAFDNLRDLIEQSRDDIIVHIDEKIGELRNDIILNDDNEFIVSDQVNSELELEEDAENVCNPTGQEPVCGEFGECVLSEDKESFTCLCEHGFTGETCQLIDHCAEITCQNGGECINNREGFECDCSDGWYGEHCEIARE